MNKKKNDEIAVYIRNEILIFQIIILIFQKSYR